MQPTAPQSTPDSQRRLNALLNEATILSRMHHLPLAAAILDAEIARTRVVLNSASGAHKSDGANDSNRAISPVVGSTSSEPPPSARELGSRFRLGPAASVAGGNGLGASSSEAHGHLLSQPHGLATEGMSSNVPASGNTTGGGSSLGVRKRIRLKVPAEKYPEYNFVGRLLGPRGATLKKLERDTGCKIMIRGRGSIRKDKEADVRGKPGWEHVFNENLHVVIEVSDAPDEHFAQLAVTRAKEAVELLLVPVPEEKDSLKRQQLRELAILNGTFRASDPHLSVVASAAAHQLRLAPTPPPTPHHSAAHAMDSRPTSVAVAAAAAAAHAAQAASFSNSHGLLNGSHPYGALRPQASHMSRLPPASPVLRSTQRNGGGASAEMGGSSRNGVGPREMGVPGSTLRIPSLDIEAMSESFLASPAAAAGGIPASSPTIVDPDIYPFPPTPGFISGEGSSSATAYGSPIWSPMHSAPAAPPPMPAPLHQSGHAQYATSHVHQAHVQQYPQPLHRVQQLPAGPPTHVPNSPRSSPPPEPERQQHQHYLFPSAQHMNQPQHPYDYHQLVGATAAPQQLSRLSGMLQPGHSNVSTDGLGHPDSSGMRSFARQAEGDEVLYRLMSSHGDGLANGSQPGLSSLSMTSPSVAVAAAATSGGSPYRRETASSGSLDAVRSTSQLLPVVSSEPELSREPGEGPRQHSGEPSSAGYLTGPLYSAAHPGIAEGRTVGFQFRHPESVDDGDSSTAKATMRALHE